MAAKIVDIFTGINYSRYQVNRGQGWLKNQPGKILKEPASLMHQAGQLQCIILS